VLVAKEKLEAPLFKDAARGPEKARSVADYGVVDHDA